VALPETGTIAALSSIRFRLDDFRMIVRIWGKPTHLVKPNALFLTVLLGVCLRRLFTVMSGVSCVSSRRVGVVCALLMMCGVVVLGRFTVMVRSVRMVF
jgi:hypothetical protein